MRWKVMRMRTSSTGKGGLRAPDVGTEALLTASGPGHQVEQLQPLSSHHQATGPSSPRCQTPAWTCPAVAEGRTGAARLRLTPPLFLPILLPQASLGTGSPVLPAQDEIFPHLAAFPIVPAPLWGERRFKGHGALLPYQRFSHKTYPGSGLGERMRFVVLGRGGSHEAGRPAVRGLRGQALEKLTTLS